MKRCTLKGYGGCSGKISREHFVSEVVLRQLSLGTSVTVGGFTGQPPMTLQERGIGAMQSRILCEGHNRGLSRLDSTAGRLLRAFDSIDKHPDESPPLVQFVGPDVERWFLKVVCGLVVGLKMADGVAPTAWKSALVGGAFPEGWGLYVLNSGEPQALAKDIHIELRTKPGTNQVAAAQFFYAGICFHLLLGRPDDPKAFGDFRPRGLIFRLPDGGERRVEFVWPSVWRSSVTDAAVIYTRLGATGDAPAYTRDWKPSPLMTGNLETPPTDR